MFEISQLRCFVSVAEELHFGRGAARLNLTQPPVSRRVQQLEESIGVRLLDRTNRSVKLTPAGRNFLREAKRLLRMAENAAATANRIAKGEAGTLTLGFTAGSTYSFLPHLLSMASHEVGGITLTLREMVTVDQMEALWSNDIDLGLSRLPAYRRGLEMICVVREPLLVALPQKHPLASRTRVPVEALDQHPFVMYSADEGQYLHGLLTHLFRQAGIAPHYVQHMAQIHTILALVSAGIGLSVVPESAQNLHFKNVAFLPIAFKPKVSCELYLVWRSQNDNPALSVFCDFVKRDFSQNLKAFT